MTTKKTHDIAETFIIEELDTLKKLTHPQRIEILHSLAEPRTVKEIAEEIDADPTKLYYHIRQLEQIKAIRVVETNIVSGIVEKKYYVTAKNYTVKDSLFSGENSEASEEDFTNMLNAIFKSTVTQAKRSAQAGLIDLDETAASNKRKTTIMSRMFRLNDTQLEEFGNRMQALMDDFGEEACPSDSTNESESEDHTDYIFTLAFFPRSPSSLDE